ncbi:Tex family protein [Nitrincola alkalilacustris]|uniref:Tex family protein n=1 Tax=Nitrincola alkalilacustris TaxID=1571224 RepID=UPI00124C2AC7|nr:Tex family protein [Nitrincola alkalilacustris]
MSITQQLATELGARPNQIEATIALMDGGATVPFIARYRKEITGGLDDIQLRTLHQRLAYLRDLEQRRQSILEQLKSQGNLTPELESALRNADNKARLEDLYLPFKPKRRNKAQEAREAGLQPLADKLLQPGSDPLKLASGYLNPEAGINDTEAALEGARFILLEQLTESADLIGQLRTLLWKQGELQVRAARGKADPDSKFRDYFEYSEAIAKIPSHRALAILRGHQEGVLKYALQLPENTRQNPAELIADHWRLRFASSSAWLQTTLQLCWDKKLRPQLETDLIRQLQEQASDAAISVFGRNLRDLLLAPPAGARATLGLDPGLRTGVKVAVVDPTGKLLECATIYPHVPHKRWRDSLDTLSTLCRRYKVSLIAVGNGTASRETEQLAKELATREKDLQMQTLLVSEAGASVYSASALAAEEFPELDVSLRSGISIARRLQDPLPELVKIDPRSIGVGQYQHDVDQTALAQSLDSVVEDCVNHVGVDLNTASRELLSRVAGLNRTTAENIVQYREQHGRFEDRQQLLKVPRLGPKAFEQCAGFLRIRDGRNPLDNSAVHPESYALVRRIAQQLGCQPDQLLGNAERLSKVDVEALITPEYGRFTIIDVLRELEKPGRDPRPAFRSVNFDEQVQTLNDLQPGMQLEGVVTNVTNFGAFVDIGVHQDGLVHISQLADRFVSDPHEVVQSGAIVQVRVVEVDVARRRIALSMKSAPEAGKTAATPDKSMRQSKPELQKPEPQKTVEGSLADKLRAAGLVKGR